MKTLIAKRESPSLPANWPEIGISWADSTVFLLLLLIPMASMVAFGAVDMWAFGFLGAAAAAIMIAWLADAWRIGEFRFNTAKLQIPIIGLIFLGLVQLLPIGDQGTPPGLLNIPAASSLSLDPYATRIFVIRLVIYLIFLAAALTFINSVGRIRAAVVTVVIFGALMAFFGILQKLANPGAIYGIRPTPQAISFGSLVNQHHFAAFMEMVSGLALGLIFGNGVKKDKKILLVICAVLAVLALVFTSSRGGMISFAGVAIFAAAASRFTSASSSQQSAVSDQRSADGSRLQLLVGGAAFILVVFGLAVFLGADNSLIRGLGLAGGEADVTSGRSHFWQVALKVFLANPIIGAGLDAFGAAFTRFDTRNGVYRVVQAHNDYLQMLADGGIVGFTLAAGFVALLFRKGLRAIVERRDGFARSAAIGAMAGCFGILIHSFFDFPLRTPANAFFFLLLAAVATVDVEKNHFES